MKASTDVADACRRRARFLDQHSARMLGRSHAAADKNQIVSGTLVSFYAFFERQLEALFLGLLTGSLAHPTANVRPLAHFLSSEAADAIVRSGKKYIDWLPFERHTMERSRVYFENGEPFDRLSVAERRVLEELGLLRNALAHQSAHSLSRFHKVFVEGRALPTSQSTPAGYLRGDQSLGTTRLSYYLLGAAGIMNRLCS
jgi:hypothetical protein